MADIASAAQKINDIEVAQDAPITEALMTKFGGNINYLLDLGIQAVTFTSSGTWVCPAGISHAILIGCGGGMGGSFVSTPSGAAPGGLGSIGQILYSPLVSGGSYAVAIGAGGAGATSVGYGSPGSNTTFVGPSASIRWLPGGQFGIFGLTGGYQYGNSGGLVGAFSDGYNTVSGGYGAYGGTAGMFGDGGFGSLGSPSGSAAANTGGGGGGANANAGGYATGNGGSGKIIAILFK
jgi:trimeric autotransporter adhesin